MLISDPYSLNFQIELSNFDSFYLYIRIIEGPDNSQNAGFPEICKGSKKNIYYAAYQIFKHPGKSWYGFAYS